jgi:hypothetical protein
MELKGNMKNNINKNRKYMSIRPDPPNVPKTGVVTLCELREWLDAAPGLGKSSLHIFARTVQLYRNDVRPACERLNITLNELAETVNRKLQSKWYFKPATDDAILQVTKEDLLKELELQIHEEFTPK